MTKENTNIGDMYNVFLKTHSIIFVVNYIYTAFFNKPRVYIVFNSWKTQKPFQ